MFHVSDLHTDDTLYHNVITVDSIQGQELEIDFSYNVSGAIDPPKHFNQLVAYS